MTRLSIDENLIASLTRELAPLVASITGWDLDISAMRSRVLPREQGYEEIVERRLRLLGMQVPQKDLVTRAVEMLVEKNVLAAYEPLSNEILVVRENVDDSNLDGLKLVVGHELAHRAQHVHHPSLFARINAILVRVLGSLDAGLVDFQKIMGYYEEVKPLMTLIESHATYVQGVLRQKYYPNGQIETRFTLPVILFRILGAGKMSQYTEALPDVKASAQKGTVDRLFASLGG